MSIPSGPVGVGSTDGSSLVNVQELMEYMSNTTLSDRQQENAARVLRGVQNELELYLNRPLQPMRVRQVAHVDQAGYANLYVSPIWEIKEVTLPEGLIPWENPFGIPAQLTPYTPAPGEAFADFVEKNFSATMPSFRSGGVFIGYPNTDVLVDYIGGYNGYYNDALKVAIMRVASRDVEQSDDDFVSLQDDQATQARKSDQRQKGWTLEEKQVFDRLRRRVMA